MSDKTEEASPKRLRKAREEGDSGASAFAAQAVAFIVVLPLLPGAVAAAALHTSDGLRAAFVQMAKETMGPASVRVSSSEMAFAVVSLTLPLLLAAGVVGAVVHLVQTGGVVATKKLSPDLNRLNLFKGIQGLASSARLFAVARALVGGGVVAWLGYGGLRTHIADLARSSGQLATAGRLAGQIARTLVQDAAIVGLALGAVDLLVVRRAWLKRLRMSKDEVKREHKENEGDPQLKAARDRAHREVVAAATIASVRTASVVVVNPTHLACALRYEEGETESAPVVVAAGEGDLAARIVRAARECGVPIVRDVPLARALYELEVGDQIPEALYEAVAEILREAWERG